MAIDHRAGPGRSLRQVGAAQLRGRARRTAIFQTLLAWGALSTALVGILLAG